MRLRHIEIFEAIQRTGTLTQAADLLHISQPAASKLLANAEAQLGFPLFERVKGRLVPTQEAHILAPQIARLSQDLANTRRLAHSLKQGRQGHLRIGCTPALGMAFLPAVVAGFQKQNPNVTFDIRTQHTPELIDSLQTRDLDLILTFSAMPSPGLELRQIGATELVRLSRQPQPDSASLATLAEVPLILLDARDPAGGLLQQALEHAGIPVQPSILVQTHYVACALVEAGCGDAIVDALTAQAMLKPGMYSSRLEPAIQVPLCVMTHHHEAQGRLQTAFVQALESAASC